MILDIWLGDTQAANVTRSWRSRGGHCCSLSHSWCRNADGTGGGYADSPESHAVIVIVLKLKLQLVLARRFACQRKLVEQRDGDDDVRSSSRGVEDPCGRLRSLRSNSCSLALLSRLFAHDTRLCVL